jgi:hypothetical protein
VETELLVFSGNANRKLAERICKYLDIPLGAAAIGKFSDGETRVEIESNVRGRDVFLIQPTCAPANEHIMELLIMVDALKRASANRITAVIPYYGYGRQERKSAPRTPISAKLVANLVESAGAHRLLTLELHTSAVQGFFNIPVDHLFSKPVFCEKLLKANIEDLIVVSPDAGGVEPADDPARGFDPKAFEAEHFLHRDDLAFHAGDLGHGGDAALAVRQALQLDDHPHGGGDLAADRLLRQRQAGHAERTKAAGGAHRGADFGIGHPAHTGEQNGVLDIEQVTDRGVDGHLIFSE